jgi:hypothetical protein
MDKKLDYSTRAEKVFISQLLPCLEQTAKMGLSTWVPGRHDKWFMQHPAGEIAFQRVWLQVGIANLTESFLAHGKSQY